VSHNSRGVEGGVKTQKASQTDGTSISAVAAEMANTIMRIQAPPNSCGDRALLWFRLHGMVAKTFKTIEDCRKVSRQRDYKGLAAGSESCLVT